MRFLREMYVSPEIKNKQKIIWKLRHGAGLTDIYVISLSQGTDQLECTHCAYFKQKAVRENVGTIVGLAKGYEQALNLIVSMVEEAMDKSQSANVKEYLLHHKQ